MASSSDAGVPERGPGPFNILFVCTGNTCRSPMAMALARAELERRGWRQVAVRSAGVAAAAGQPAADFALEVLAEKGLDLGSHRTTPLTPELVEWADLIAVMGPGHIRALEAMDADGKVSLVTDFLDTADAGTPVPDPIGGSEALYRETRDRLAEAVAAMLDRLEPILAP